jgi:hypothetical protein
VYDVFPDELFRKVGEDLIHKQKAIGKSRRGQLCKLNIILIVFRHPMFFLLLIKRQLKDDLIDF